MASQNKIRIARTMIAKAQLQTAMAKSPAERPTELLAEAFAIIDDLLSDRPDKPVSSRPKKRLPN